MIKIVGIAGFARSGKDTVCEFIREYLKSLVVPSFRYALADPIKQQVNEVFGWDDRHGYGDLKEVSVETELYHDTLERVVDESFRDHFDGDTKELAYKFHQILYNEGCIKSTVPFFGFSRVVVSPRQMYQLWGTEFTRCNISDDIWFRFAESVAESSEGSVMVIPDVRFMNEAEWINDNPQAILIGVDRPDNEAGIGTTHSSEKDIPEVLENFCDAVIENTGTLEELREVSETVIKALVVNDGQ